MSFVKRQLDITITVKQSGETMTLTGHRAGVYIAYAGGDAQGVMQCQIFGLPLETINRLTRMGPVQNENVGNRILVAAGSDGDKALIFEGIINQAWGDMSAQPDVPLNIIAGAAIDAALTPANASSYRGGVSVTQIMGDLAKKSGWAFEPNGVNVQLENVYLSGSTLEQIRSLARQAHINWDVQTGKLIIWPMDSARTENNITLISPETGLVGYPTFSSSGVMVQVVFNKEIQLGNKVNIQSSIIPACGEWTVNRVNHSLEAENTNGNGTWFSTISCVRGNK